MQKIIFIIFFFLVLSYSHLTNDEVKTVNEHLRHHVLDKSTWVWIQNKFSSHEKQIDSLKLEIQKLKKKGSEYEY